MPGGCLHFMYITFLEITNVPCSWKFISFVINDSVTSYGPSHLGPSFPPSLAWLASLLWSTSAVQSVGMPISAGMTASVSYVSENGVSSLLDFIMVRCAHRTYESYPIQSLLLSSNRALILSLRLLFALSTKPFACGCFMKAKHWRIHSFLHQSLNGLSRNCFPLSDTISP
ncbi:hypothetical protein Tco_1381450, partial [Tanacetum coccineum]